MHNSAHNRSFIKLLPHGVNNFLKNTQISVDDEKMYLQEAYHFKDGADKGEDLEDNINVDALQKVDFSKYFYKQPSQVALGRPEGDLTLSEHLDVKSKFYSKMFLETEVEEPESLLSKKTYREDCSDSQNKKAALLEK